MDRAKQAALGEVYQPIYLLEPAIWSRPADLPSSNRRGLGGWFWYCGDMGDDGIEGPKSALLFYLYPLPFQPQLFHFFSHETLATTSKGSI